MTGNPRIDLLSPWGRQAVAHDVKKIRKRFGNYILFNTNFGWVNSIWNATEDTKQILVRTGRLKVDDPDSVAVYEATVSWEKANMAELEKTIAWAVNHFSNRAIIIRPHPAEDPSYWVSRFDKYDNVTIVKDSAHAPGQWALR